MDNIKNIEKIKNIENIENIKNIKNIKDINIIINFRLLIEVASHQNIDKFSKKQNNCHPKFCHPPVRCSCQPILTGCRKGTEIQNLQTEITESVMKMSITKKI